MISSLPDRTEQLPFPTDVNAVAPRFQPRRFRLHEIQAAEPKLSCRLPLADTWERDASPTDSRDIEGFTELVSFQNARLSVARLTIRVTRLPREVHPSDWLDAVLNAKGERILETRDFVSAAGDLPDRLTRNDSGVPTTVTRWAALKDDDRLFVVEARVSLGDYAAHADEMLLMVAGFSLCQPSESPFAEPIEPCESPRRLFRFARPASWEARPERREHYERCVLTSSSAGEITITMVPRTPTSTVDDLFVCERHALRERGVTIEPGVATTFDGTRWMSRGWSLERPARNGPRTVDVRVVILESATARVAIRGVGPSRAHSPGEWAVQRRAFEIVRESLQVSM